MAINDASFTNNMKRVWVLDASQATHLKRRWWHNWAIKKPQYPVMLAYYTMEDL